MDTVTLTMTLKSFIFFEEPQQIILTIPNKSKTVLSPSQVDNKESNNKQSVSIAKTRSQPVKSDSITGKIFCEMYHEAVWISMTREQQQQMQVMRLLKQQGIKPIPQRQDTEAQIAVLEAQIWNGFCPEDGNIMTGEWERLPQKNSEVET